MNGSARAAQVDAASATLCRMLARAQAAGAPAQLVDSIHLRACALVTYRGRGKRTAYREAVGIGRSVRRLGR